VSHVGAGTETWMPPEGHSQGQGGQMDYPFSYDVHPCGSLLYFILSGGEHAFAGNHVYETQRNLIEGKHRKLRDLVNAFKQTNTLAEGESKTSSSHGQTSSSEAEKIHPMEFHEAMHLIEHMLQRHPNSRPKPLGGEDASLCMQVVLDHPFFMTSTAKLEHVKRGKDTNWSSLQNKYLNGKQSVRWVNIPRLKNAKAFLEVAGQANNYNNNLKGLARFIRNVREHVYDCNGKTDSDLASFFEVDVVKREETTETDDMLVKYFAKAVPDLFLQLLKWPIQW